MEQKVQVKANRAMRSLNLLAKAFKSSPTHQNTFFLGLMSVITSGYVQAVLSLPAMDSIEDFSQATSTLFGEFVSQLDEVCSLLVPDIIRNPQKSLLLDIGELCFNNVLDFMQPRELASTLRLVSSFFNDSVDKRFLGVWDNRVIEGWDLWELRETESFSACRKIDLCIDSSESSFKSLQAASELPTLVDLTCKLQCSQISIFQSTYVQAALKKVMTCHYDSLRSLSISFSGDFNAVHFSMLMTSIPSGVNEVYLRASSKSFPIFTSTSINWENVTHVSLLGLSILEEVWREMWARLTVCISMNLSISITPVLTSGTNVEEPPLPSVIQVLESPCAQNLLKLGLQVKSGLCKPIELSLEEAPGLPKLKEFRGSFHLAKLIIPKTEQLENLEIEKVPLKTRPHLDRIYLFDVLWNYVFCERRLIRLERLTINCVTFQKHRCEVVPPFNSMHRKDVEGMLLQVAPSLKYAEVSRVIIGSGMCVRRQVVEMQCKYHSFWSMID